MSSTITLSAVRVSSTSLKNESSFLFSGVATSSFNVPYLTGILGAYGLAGAATGVIVLFSL